MTVDYFVHCQHFDHEFDALGPTVKMVRARRVESERSEWLALTAVMTATSAVHRKAARALFRFRKSAAAGQHDLLAIVKMPAAFGPTRPRSRATSRGRPIRTYVGTVLPAWQPQKTNWCHGLSAENDTSRPVGQHHCAAENGRSVSFFPLRPPFYDSDGPGEAWNGSGRPVRRARATSEVPIRAGSFRGRHRPGTGSLTY